MEKEIVFVLLDEFADWEAAFLAPALCSGVMPGRPAADGAFKMSMAARMLADCPRLREQEESKISIITTGFRAYVCTR